MFLSVALLVPLAVFLIYRIVLWAIWLRKVNQALATIPVMGEPHWLLGNIGVIRAKGGFVNARAEAFEKLDVQTMKAYLGPVPIIVTRDLDLFKFIHNNQGNSDTPFVRVDAPMLNRVVGETSLVATDGDAWSFHRKNLEPLFHHSNLNGVFPMIMEHCRRLERRWLQECEKNPITRSADIIVDDQLKELSTGVIAYLAFSTDIGALNSDEKHPMTQRFSDIARSMERVAMLPPIIQNISWMPDRRQLEREVAKADLGMFETIKQRRKCSETAQQHIDLVDLLLNEKVSPPYTDRSIRDQCITLYWAGQETTSLFMTWGLYYLAHYPAVQKALYEALEDLPDTFTFEQINRIEYLTFFVQETLRMSSIVPSTVKQSSTDATVYNGIRLPAGLWLLCSLHDIQRSAKYFPDPLKFDPDRWADKKRHSMDAFVAFTKGEKTCIGQKLALMEAKALFAHMVTKFQISEVPGFDIVVKKTFVCRPEGGVKIRVSVRS